MSAAWPFDEFRTGLGMKRAEIDKFGRMLFIRKIVAFAVAIRLKRQRSVGK